MIHELQPLRLQTGWTVQWNDFTEYDMAVHGPGDAFELHEDLLQLFHQKTGLTIDLGWYPSYDPGGHYRLLLVQNHQWDQPLERVETRLKAEVIACVEKWVNHGFWSKYKI